MEFKDVVSNRRSVRKYIDKDISIAKIESLIELAQEAPSWKNSEVTKYYVAKGEKLEEVRKCLPDFNKRNTENAPVIIVSTIIPKISGFNPDGTESNELGNGWGFYDCGLQNMILLLGAAEEGLSTLVMGIRDALSLKNTLNIPDEEIVVSVIALGYTNAMPIRPKRKLLKDVLKVYED